MESYREFAVKLATRTGKELLSHFKKDRKLLGLRGTVKGIVTKYDINSNREIIKAISNNYPSYNIWTEESGFFNRHSEYTWIVDPLDGTVNFAAGNPLFCVILSLLKKNEPVLGVTYAPAINELFVAEKDQGALLNRKRISVSSSRKLKESYVYSCEGGERNRIRTGKINNMIYLKVRDLRKLGSAGIECAWVACGKGDAFVTVKIEPWDISAGVLLIKEAGGKATDFKGKPVKAERSDLVFSNGKIHESMVNLVRGV